MSTPRTVHARQPQAECNAEATAVELESGVPYRSLIVTTAPGDQPPPTEEDIRKRSQEIVAHNDPLAHAALTRAGRELVVTDSQMADVRVPALAIVRMADPAVEGVKTLKDAWPELQLVTVEGATHWGDRGILFRQEFADSLRQFIEAHSVLPFYLPRVRLSQSNPQRTCTSRDESVNTSLPAK